MKNNKIFLSQEDITVIEVDAIVNAANTSLEGGGGVDGMIHQAAGNELNEACRLLNGCLTGDAKITKGFNLPSRFIIHTVGPIWNGGDKNEEALLASCYKRSLEVAVENKCKTIAFPNISTGIYHFPKELAAKIAIETIIQFLANDTSIEKVYLICFSKENYKIYKTLLDNL
jgi:O-acetyl-ADP-ribose deacetylase (regulator of RNase III)